VSKLFKMAISIASANWSFVPGDEVILQDYVADAWQEAGHGTIIGDAEGDTMADYDNAATADATERDRQAQAKLDDQEAVFEEITADVTKKKGK